MPERAESDSGVDPRGDEREELIADCAAGDESAAERLTIAYGGLVHHTIERYGHGLPADDALAAALLALIEAARRYERGDARGASFGTFAFHRLRGALTEARDLEAQIPGGSNAKRTLERALRDVMPAGALAGLNPRDPSDDELARAAKRARLSVASARRIIELRRRQRPLLEESDSGDDDWSRDHGDTGLAPWDEPEPTLEELALAEGRIDAVRNAVRRLPEPLQTLVAERYPRADSAAEPATLDELGRRLSRTGEAIRLQLEQAIEQLRTDDEIEAWR